MMIINAFRIIEHRGNEVEIVFHKSDPALHHIYGQDRLSTSLLLPEETQLALRTLLEVNDKVSTHFFIEKILRRYKGIDRIMSLIRSHKLKYKISAHTHC